VVPPGPVARAVYVVEVDGLTERLPVASTVPIPLSMAIEVVFDDLHVKVEDCPCSIDDGEAERVMVGTGGGGAGGGVSTFGGGGGGGVTFFLHPDPVTAISARKTSTTASVYRDLLIRCASFLH
jgi:hypothetical protein